MLYHGPSVFEREKFKPMRMKIINIVGARPNLPKIAPLMREMQRHPEIEPILVHTGQHYDEALSDIFFRQMGIPTPHVNLEVGSGSMPSRPPKFSSASNLYCSNMSQIIVLAGRGRQFHHRGPLAAVKLGVPVAHVEAGLRSFDRSMPEEINRILTDALADYLFVTEEDAIEHLLKEGASSRIDLSRRQRHDRFSADTFCPSPKSLGIGDALGLKNGTTGNASPSSLCIALRT